MDFFPLFANLRDQPCLVVGGGPVAARKARELVAAGASVTVNAPDFDPALKSLAAEGRVRLHVGTLEPALVSAQILIVAATSDAEVNRRVAEAARDALRLCNVVDDGAQSSVIFPAIVERGPLTIAVSSGGRSPVLARVLRQRLEQWLPAGIGALAEWLGSLRAEVKRRLPDIAARRAYWERLLAGPAPARFLAGDDAGAARAAAALLDGEAHTAATAPLNTTGRAWLVGAGPGDPGLISVRGLEVLQQADVVLHDRLVAPELLRAARREAEIVSVGKTGGGPSARQEDINRLLVSHVRAGRKVCRLKGGDPLIFGRGGEEAQALAAAGLPFEIVPGITAASGCAAHAGIPLTQRGLAEAVTLVTASTAPGTSGPDWSRLAATGHTLVIYMGGAQVDAIAAALVTHGRAAATPAAIVTNGTTAAQRVVTGTLEDIGARSAAAKGISPALLIVGETVALAHELAWRDTPAHDAAVEPFLQPPAAFTG